MNIDNCLDLYDRKIMSDVQRGDLREKTRETYVGCMDIIGRYMLGNDMGNIYLFRGDVLRKFFKDKRLTSSYRQFMKYVSALRYMEKKVLGIEKCLLFGDVEKELFEEAKKSKNIYSRNVGSGLSSEQINKKINALRNNKLKLCFRLGIRSGLRVSELSKLCKEDVEIADGEIIIAVKDGKGGKDRAVKCLEDQYLVEKLSYHITTSKKDKLFYSESHMKNKAGELGFQMHDLRRCFSKDYLSLLMSQGKSRSEAKEIVKQYLGHSKSRTTEIYIKSKKRSVVNV